MNDKPNSSGTGNTTEFLDLDNTQSARALMGERGIHLKQLEKETGTAISARGNRVCISGRPESVLLAMKAVRQLYNMVEKGYAVFSEDIRKTLDMLHEDASIQVEKVLMDTIAIPSSPRPIAPKTRGQQMYVEAIRTNTVTFGVGPAGTGKTYLAVAMAVSSLLARECRRIVLARPAVEAGEKLGFLPGDIAEKVNPYLRPLYDALEDMMDVERVQRFIERGAIEIAPLAFMRGRTLNDSFVILDEAQNTTPEQMKMFLTRFGYNSKAVVTGDVTQIDLPVDKSSGLVHALSILKDIEGIAQIRLGMGDVVRHPLVARIAAAYDRDKERREGQH